MKKLNIETCLLIVKKKYKLVQNLVYKAMFVVFDGRVTLFTSVEVDVLRKCNQL